MNKQRYIALLQDPSAVTKADIPDIEELIAQFPYCQNAHILLAKIQHESGSMHAAKLTRKAALYTSDRTKLKRLLATPATPAKVLLPEEKTIPVPEEKVTPVVSEEITHEVTPPSVALVQAEITDSIEQTDSITVQTSGNIIPPPAVETPVSRNIKHEADKHANAFLTELEENLKALHESKVRAANLFKEDPAKKQISKAEPPVEPVKEAPETETAALPAAAEIAPAVETPVSPVSEAITPTVEIQKAETDTAVVEKDFFSSLDDVAKTEETEKKSYSALIEAELPKKDLPKGNDVLDLILSFDNRVKDYFDINEYAAKNKSAKADDDSFIKKEVKAEDQKSDDVAYRMPFSNADWKLEESRLEEAGQNSSSLLLNYLEFLKEQKNKKQQPDKKREKSIISRFIEKDPMISPLTYSAYSEDENNEQANNQVKPAFVSETFAKLLEKQGKFQKAIAVYEELILKNPEKNSYFASLIQELKKKL